MLLVIRTVCHTICYTTEALLYYNSFSMTGNIFHVLVIMPHYISLSATCLMPKFRICEVQDQKVFIKLCFKIDLPVK